MRRIVIFAALLLCAAALCFFDLFGGAMRDALSPEVTCVYPEFAVFGGSAYYKLPESAVYESDGLRYVFAVRPSDKYRERSFEAVMREAEVTLSGGTAYVGLSTLNAGEPVILNPPDGIEDGTRVVVEFPGGE